MPFVSGARDELVSALEQGTMLDLRPGPPRIRKGLSTSTGYRVRVGEMDLANEAATSALFRVRSDHSSSISAASTPSESQSLSSMAATRRSQAAPAGRSAEAAGPGMVLSFDRSFASGLSPGRDGDGELRRRDMVLTQPDFAWSHISVSY